MCMRIVIRMMHIMWRAIEEGRMYPKYIWLTPGWYQGGWWSDDEAYLLSLNCSLTSLQQQLNRSLALLAHPNNVRITLLAIFMIRTRVSQLTQNWMWEFFGVVIKFNFVQKAQNELKTIHCVLKKVSKVKYIFCSSSSQSSVVFLIQFIARNLLISVTM